MIRPLAVLLFTLLCSLSFAQDGSSPENRRYLNPIFDSVKFTEGIVYGEKPNDQNGQEAEKEVLKLRVFEPANDSNQRRPLVLIIPGGGFVVTGETWMNEFAEKLAKSGYVVALNNYRLSDNTDTPEAYFNALAKAVGDQRDAITYLINDAEKENRFGIDPSKIFIGGHSAGAITSMHTAYMDSNDALLPLMRDIFDEHKLLIDPESKIALKGVISLSGLLSNLAIMGRNDVPLLSLHGDADSVINVKSDENIFGAIAIHQYADIVGTENELHVIKGALHNDTSISPLCEECIPLIKRFMFNQLHKETKQ